MDNIDGLKLFALLLSEKSEKRDSEINKILEENRK